MAIAYSTRTATATLSAGQTGPINCAFPVFAAADLVVTRLRAGVTSTLVLTTDYTVTIAGDGLSAQVNLTAGAVAGDQITVDGRMLPARSTSFEAYRAWRSTSVNQEFDRMTAQLQEMRRDADRAVATASQVSSQTAAAAASATAAAASAATASSAQTSATASAAAATAAQAAAEAAAAAAAFIMPIGMIAMWMVDAAPAKWLRLEGQAVSRTTYATLFGVYGTRFGAGDGTTTFNLPDMRGEFPRGTDRGRGTDPDAASRTDRGDGTTGNAVGTKQAAQTASHTHGPGTLAGTTNTTGAHTHVIGQNTSASSGAGQGVTSSGGSGSTASAGDHSHTVSVSSGTTAATGGNETRPRNVAMDFYVYAGV